MSIFRTRGHRLFQGPFSLLKGNTLKNGMGRPGTKGLKCAVGRMDINFLPQKAEIEEKKMVEISTGNTSEISTNNTPKSHDFQGKSSFFSDIALPEISTV